MISANRRVLQTTHNAQKQTTDTIITLIEHNKMVARRHTDLHAVLAYCHQKCTTSKLRLGTQLLVPRPKTTRCDTLTSMSMERLKRRWHAPRSITSHNNLHTHRWRNAPDSPNDVWKNQSMCCPHRNTLRSVSCRVFIFQHCSWHMQGLCQNLIGTAPTSAATSSPNFLNSVIVIKLCTTRIHTRCLLSQLCMLGCLECRVVPFSLQSVLLQLNICNRPLLTHMSSQAVRAPKKMSVPHFGSNALRLSSNPRASVLELDLDESGTNSSSCSDNKIRRWKSLLQTLSSRQLSQQWTKEKAARNLMERLAQLEEETIRIRTIVNLKERSQTHTELVTLGRSTVSTREPRDGNEWSLIFEAHNAAGTTQLAQILKIIQDGGATPFLAQLNWTMTANHYFMLANLTNGRMLALVQLAEPRNRQTNWQKLVVEYALSGTQ